MVIGDTTDGNVITMAHPSGIPQEKIDNIMSGISNTGAVKMNNHRKKLRQRFDIIKKLGQGTYGKVQLGINKETGQEVAIKTIKKCKIEAEADLIRIRREVQIMSSVQHPNIIHIYEVFENREKMVLVMEFAAGGELYDYLSERKVLAEEEARRIFRQVATAVYYCHKHKICHRDLKLENILLDENGNAKIADFGLSNVFDEQRLLATFCGSPLYASPEIVKGTPYLGPEVDCWSLGVLLYTLVYGSMPFDGSNFKRLVKQISQGDYFEPKKPSRASPLIKDMLTVCPRKRSTIESICNHWWVNEGNEESCLDLAESLANQTPVRLDVLLSLSPVSVTADQLVVPSIDPVTKSNERVPRSHSVGSIRDIPPNTEAERRILDMVAAGGEAALMPSPTRTITPVQSPVQTKRKLENTMSMNNAAGAIKKKEKPTEPVQPIASETKMNAMDVDIDEKELKIKIPESSTENDKAVEEKCDQIIADSVLSQQELTITPKLTVEEEAQSSIARQKTLTKLDAVKEAEEIQEDLSPPRVVKKFINKHKTADLVAAINKISPEKSDEFQKSVTAVRKNSLPDESIGKFNTERRRSRILETAEKFQNMNNSSVEKPKKFVIPGVSVGNFKKEFERKASLTTMPGLSSAERRALEKRSESVDQGSRKNSCDENIEDSEISVLPIVDKLSVASTPIVPATVTVPNKQTNIIAQKEAKENVDLNMSFTNFSLEEARRSMENSIALLNQAKNESSNEVDQLCAKTGNVSVSDIIADRERKLRNAREIIGNAIQPGIRKPSPYGINGRSISGGINLPSPTIEKRQYRLGPSDNSLASQSSIKPSPTSTDKNRSGPIVKTSRAEITLKSATLPRRKAAKSEIQLDIKPIIDEQSPMRFSTEMQHPIMDLRSAPVHEGSSPYSPISSSANNRSISLEPQLREHIIPIQRPPAYTRTSSNTTNRSGSLSRQSTNDSESDTTTNYSQSTITGTSQPIKKSPREFIIPIAVEGGGFITPRAGSIEPSESSQTTGSNSTFSIIGRPPRRFGTLFSEADVEEDSPFQKKRNTSLNRESEDEPRFTMHRLRSTRPAKKPSQDNDSQSSGEEDDDDGFEILTAENLFSTLLSRVRALTNRLNVNNDITTGFPSNSRVLNNMRQPHSSFWNQEPFGSRLNSASNIGAPWRHSMSRDLGSEMESMFNRAGATLPRGCKQTKCCKSPIIENQTSVKSIHSSMTNTEPDEPPPLDLADLDLSRLRLSKKDLETLSSITPDLPQCFQEQLLAKLPPTQARKLSRTLSMKNNTRMNPVRIYKRSQSDGQELADEFHNDSKTLKDTPTTIAKFNDVPQEEVCDKNTNVVSHHSLTKCQDVMSETKNRSSYACRGNDDSSKSLCSSFSSDISDKYKYYSPYLSKGRESDSSSISPYRRYDSLSPRDSCLSPTKEVCGRPPNGCLSPPPMTADNLMRRRPSQRRISRFLRPDFFDESNEESAYEKEKRYRERETQSVLREIRENSRAPSRDRLSQMVDLEEITSQRTDIYNNKIDNYNATPQSDLKHQRNKSLERFCDSNELEIDLRQNRRRSLSKSREFDNDYLALTNQIIKELKILSADQRKKELTETSNNFVTTSTALDSKTDIKKVKKTKPKEKSTDSTDTTVVDSNKKETVVKKVKKIVKKIETKPKENAITPNIEVSSSKSNLDTLKRESKLKRPKSYPTKELEKHSASSNSASILSSVQKNHPIQISKTINDSEIIKEIKLVRPKSFPNSKLTPPKEIKKSTKSGSTISSVIEKFSEKSTTTMLPPKILADNNRSSVSEEKSTTTTRNSDSSSAADNIKQIPTVKKLIKVSKKVKTTVNPVKKEENKLNLKESSPSNVPQFKDKSPEKKSGKGIFYAIGQKFEKFRDSAKSKDKKLQVNNSIDSTEKNVIEQSPVDKNCIIKEKKVKTRDGSAKGEKKKDEKTDETPKPDKRSRIDAMIRSLRERSVPKTSGITESGLIKRAVSVEDMPGTFNKHGVNKVLGLFRKIEKDRVGQKVMSTRSTSNIERQFCESPSPIQQRDRPKSNDFFIKAKKNVTIADNNRKESNTDEIKNIALQKLEDCTPSFSGLCPQSKYPTCPDCIQEQSIESAAMSTKRYYDKEKTPTTDVKNDIKDKRKGLMLDFTKLENLDNLKSNRTKPFINGNGNYLNSSHTSGDLSGLNYKNNNISSSFNLSSHEINQNNVYTPSSENIANYSSDSRSYQDECASTSTFLSPTEEPELCFDNWSICSEDNFALNTPSPTIPRLSRASQYSSPTSLLGSDKTESVNDRIKRRSFYCRFNENKPKRQSNIVGQSARDYYRETEAKHRSRPERISSSEVLNSRSTHEFFKPLKLSSAGSELKPPIYKTPTSTFNNVDYSKPRKSLNDFNSTSPSALPKQRYSNLDNDYLLRHRNGSTKTSTVYTTCNSPPNYYNTYNPKRRSSYTLLNGGIAPLSSSSNIDSYATVGRRTIRPYDHRSISLLDSTIQHAANTPSSSSTALGSLAYRRDHRTPSRDITNLTRSNLNHYRSPSLTRSPTDI